MKVKDKVFVVTGGARGIGRELVLLLLSKGAHVAAIDVNEQALEELSKQFEGSTKLTAHLADITDKEHVFALPEKVIAAHGAVDGVINNAGIVQPFEDLGSMDIEKIDRVMDVNFYGMLYMTKAFLPYLEKRPLGYIANISSMGGMFPVPGQTVYGASKAAVKILTEGLQAELINSKIGVSVIIPGGISSDIMENSGVEVSSRMRRLQKIIKLTTPKKAAVKIIRAIEKNKRRKTIGIDAAAMDFICRMSPGLGEKVLYNLMRSQLY